MQNIRVQFTVPNVEQVVNLDVHVNGDKRNMKFRVETFSLNREQLNTEEMVSQIRKQIMNYDSDWKLYHIGTPYKNKIPVTFRFSQD